MPKLLVLFHSLGPDVIALAEAAAAGARGVRFAEVDLRRLEEADTAPQARATDGAGRVHRTLDHVEDITAYDGLMLALPAEGEAALALTRTFAALAGSLVNKVGSVVTAAEGAGRTALVWSALTPMADRGMILVPAPFTTTDEPPTESARRLGKRVAEVIGWVTHARSHHHHEPHQHDHHSHHHH
jgi:hypothetical protein